MLGSKFKNVKIRVCPEDVRYEIEEGGREGRAITHAKYG